MAQADFTHPEHSRSNPLAKAVARTARRAYRVLNHFVMETLGFRMTGLADLEADVPVTADPAASDVPDADRIERLRGPLLASVTALMTFGYLLLNVLPDFYAILIALGFAAAAALSWAPPALDAEPDSRGASASLRRLAVGFGAAVTPAVFGLLLGVIVWQVIMWDALYGVSGLLPESWCTCVT